MATLLFVLLCGVSVYVACSRPPWFWAVFVGGPVLLDLLADFQHFSVYAIPGGPLQLRATDIGFLGVVIGGLYHARKQGVSCFRRAPMGPVVLAILVFLFFKVIASVLFYGDQLAANRVASHVAGGLVAAIGDLREGLLPLVAVSYAYLARKSCDLRAIAWPIVVATCLLLLKAAVGVALTGKLWTGTTDTDMRFITSYDAITLTLFSWILLFVRGPRLHPRFTRSLAVLALLVATIANHRSQWVGAAAGLAILLCALLLGRPLLGRTKLLRVALSGAALLLGGLFITVEGMADLIPRSPLMDALTVRLYAVTDPARDPDSAWREKIWSDRIEQVGSDWPWGRPLGDRRETLVRGHWLNIPDHNAYVETYELGGAILCLLSFFFWGRLIQLGIFRALHERTRERMWPPIVALAVSATTLAYGSAYTFPDLGLVLAVVLILGRSAEIEPLLSAP